MNQQDNQKKRTQTRTAKPASRFPERIQYVISPEDALQAIRAAFAQISNYRDGRLAVFEKVIGPLVPQSVRSNFEKFRLDKLSISYRSLIQLSGNLISVFVLFGLQEHVENIKENYRFIILPYIELKIRQKIEQLEKKKPWGWKIQRKFYQKNLDVLAPLVDNLMNLVILAWTFCPGIGEPEMQTGFYNRFVFTSNGGFIDLGHFFNCAIVAYLYGNEPAVRRSHATEVNQRWLREKLWLTEMRTQSYFSTLTNLLWGYATSADTIEDRASDKFGILLGEAMRNCRDNGKIIEKFVALYPEFVKSSIKPSHRPSRFEQIIDTLQTFFTNIFYRPGTSSVIDIESYMKKFFEEYDAIDPKKTDIVPKGIFYKIIEFYAEKYGSPEWDAYTNKEWQVIIPQELWEQVVRHRKQFREIALPIKIQLRDTGKIVAPYPGDPP